MAEIEHIEVYQNVLTATMVEAGYGEVRKALTMLQMQARRRATGGLYSRTRALAASIYKAGPFVVAANVARFEVTGVVGSSLSYAASVESGASIHNIFPRGMPHIWRFGSTTPRVLAFTWRGRRVVTPHIPMSMSTIGRSHPGQKGKHYLRNAAIYTSLRYNFRFEPGPGAL